MRVPAELAGVTRVTRPYTLNHDERRAGTAGAGSRDATTLGRGVRDLRHGDVRVALQARLSQLRLPPGLLRSLDDSRIEEIPTRRGDTFWRTSHTDLKVRSSFSSPWKPATNKVSSRSHRTPRSGGTYRSTQVAPTIRPRLGRLFTPGSKQPSRNQRRGTRSRTRPWTPAPPSHRQHTLSRAPARSPRSGDRLDLARAFPLENRREC